MELFLQMLVHHLDELYSVLFLNEALISHESRLQLCNDSFDGLLVEDVSSKMDTLEAIALGNIDHKDFHQFWREINAADIEMLKTVVLFHKLHKLEEMRADYIIVIHLYKAQVETS